MLSSIPLSAFRRVTYTNTYSTSLGTASRNCSRRPQENEMEIKRGRATAESWKEICPGQAVLLHAILCFSRAERRTKDCAIKINLLSGYCDHVDAISQMLLLYVRHHGKHASSEHLYLFFHSFFSFLLFVQRIENVRRSSSIEQVKVSLKQWQI